MMIIVYDPDSLGRPINAKNPFGDQRGLTGRERFIFYYISFLKEKGISVKFYSKFTEDHEDGSISFVNSLDSFTGTVIHLGKFRKKFSGTKNILVYPFTKSAGTGRHLYKYINRVVVPNDVSKWTICDGLYLPIEDINKFSIVRFSSPALTRGTVEPKAVYASKWDKGLAEILAVWPIVQSRVPKARLEIYGSKVDIERHLSHEREYFMGSVEGEWGNRARYCKALYLKNTDLNIELKAHVSVNDVRHAISTASALLYPARGILPYSYHGSNIYDAYTCGTPVIAQGTRSLYEYENKHIEYVDMSNRAEFSQYIVSALENPRTAKSYQMNHYEILHRLVMSD